MEQIVICLLIVQKELNLKQKILKFQHIPCFQETFQKTGQQIGNISKDWSIDNMKKSGLKDYVYDFTVDYAIAVADILDIHKYLMKINEIV